MTTEQQINNLRRQAAEALRTGNFDLMNELDRQAQNKKRELSSDVFLQVNRQVARTQPKTIETAAVVVPAAVINQPARRVWRVGRPQASR